MNRLRSPILVVDFKYNIIRIHRSTLVALGHPKYIELIVSPSKGIIGIRAQESQTPTAQKINAESFALQRSVQLYSTNLVRELLGINPEWQNEQIYKMEGVLKDSEHIVLFDVSSSELVHSDEYATAQ
jgi:hypothetical protein